MFKFFLKKNFYDIWDTLLYLIPGNLLNMAVLSGVYLGIYFWGTGHVGYALAGLAAGAGLFMGLVFAWGANARKIADFNTPSWGLFFRSLKTTFLRGFVTGVLIVCFIGVSWFAFAYYLRGFFFQGSFLMLLVAAILAWFVLICVLALQWFVPLYFLQEENTMLKCLKKSFIIYFDNSKVSFGVFLINCFLVLITIATLGTIVGFNGITITTTNALRILLYKYDWLEEHPEFQNDKDKRNDVPWEELLAEDKELTGTRNLKGFLFPWR